MQGMNIENTNLQKDNQLLENIVVPVPKPILVVDQQSLVSGFVGENHPFSIQYSRNGGAMEPLVENKENLETFFKRIEAVFPPSEARKIRLAYIVSKAGHRGQFRKECDQNGNKIRYFEHPRRTALILLDEFHITDWEMIASCLLHDTLEDVRGFTPEMLEEYFGTEVCRIVKHVSKPKNGDEELYWTLLGQNSSWRTLAVKFADRLDNLRSLSQCGRDFQEKQIVETGEKIFPLLVRFRRDLGQNELGIRFLDKIKEAVENVKAGWK